MPRKNSSTQLFKNSTVSEELHEQSHEQGFLSHLSPHEISHKLLCARPHGHSHEHSHTHGKMDFSIFATGKGLWVVKWSFIGMMITAVLQLFIVLMSGSVALLADTIHNFGDAATAIPLAIAFTLAKRKPSKSFSYGYGRVEDLAGVTIVLLILFSAVIAGYESVIRFFNPQPVMHLQVVAAAAIIGCVGNEVVAQFRMKVGKEIGSTALIADGYHARVDGLTSLAVLIGAAGVWLGYPMIDPLIGLLIAITILKIVLDTSKPVFIHLLDGIEPEVIDKVKSVAESVEGVCEVTDLRVRWIGHSLHAEINASVSSSLSVEEGHKIANAIREKLLRNFPYLSGTTIHVDPLTVSGERFHCEPESLEMRHVDHTHVLDAP